MIQVSRGRIREPKILSDPKGKGAKETDAVKDYYANGATAPYKKYKVYQDREVKDALIELFYGKCAYCESHCLHVYSGDVEHFRPKGRINDVPANEQPEPGYYWLAATWDNLLFSCRNCNQKLKHKLHGETDLRTMGKMDQFPTQNNYWARRPDADPDITHEQPLLLNPCKDDPEQHLYYDEASGAIFAKKDPGGVESIKGRTSIDVFVLQRLYLVQEREKRLIEIQAQIERVQEALLLVDKLSEDDSEEQFRLRQAELRLKKEIRRLKKFLSPDEEYLGMARQVIYGFLGQYGIERI